MIDDLTKDNMIRNFAANVIRLGDECREHALEVKRLKAEVERLDTLCKQLMKQHSDISCENIVLRQGGQAIL